MKKIGFVGLGIMGNGMAANLVRKGFEVTVWNRDLSKTASLKELGAKVASNVGDLAVNAEVIVTMVRDDAAVRAVLTGPDGAFKKARPGTIFIEMSTVTPNLVRDMVATAEQAGFKYLDAPVTGSKGAAADGKLNILVGGSAEVLEEQRDVLEAMSQSIIHIGPNGSSAFMKLATNQLAAVTLASLGESLALVEQAGINREMALEILVATVARVSGAKKEKILKENWDTEFTLDLMYKDLTQALAAAEELKQPMPVLAAVREKFQLARQKGLGDQDFSVISTNLTK